MANQEHLDLLKQGVDTWNRWRKENPYVKPDLRNADLEMEELANVDLSSADLTNAILRVGCENATFREADLSNAQCQLAVFSKTNFGGASLIETNFIETRLDRASFDSAYLTSTYFYRTYLDGADFSNAILNMTAFCDVDLSGVQGLEFADHYGPSSIGIDTLFLSHGHIPETFLIGAGVPEILIEYSKSLISNPIDYYSCFISYSTRDKAFAQRLHADLRSKGVRCWFAPEDLKIGEKFWHRIDESIRQYDKLLVVLSQHSVESEWVEREVMAALEKEQKSKQFVLFPIALDETFRYTSAPWAADLQRQRHIGNFTHWKNHDDYQKALNRLLRDLKV